MGKARCIHITCWYMSSIKRFMFWGGVQICLGSYFQWYKNDPFTRICWFVYGVAPVARDWSGRFIRRKIKSTYMLQGNGRKWGRCVHTKCSMDRLFKVSTTLSCKLKPYLSMVRSVHIRCHYTQIGVMSTDESISIAICQDKCRMESCPGLFDHWVILRLYNRWENFLMKKILMLKQRFVGNI